MPTIKFVRHEIGRFGDGFLNVLGLPSPRGGGQRVSCRDRGGSVLAIRVTVAGLKSTTIAGLKPTTAPMIAKITIMTCVGTAASRRATSMVTGVVTAATIVASVRVGPGAPITAITATRPSDAIVLMIPERLWPMYGGRGVTNQMALVVHVCDNPGPRHFGFAAGSSRVVVNNGWSTTVSRWSPEATSVHDHGVATVAFAKDVLRIHSGGGFRGCGGGTIVKGKLCFLPMTAISV